MTDQMPRGRFHFLTIKFGSSARERSDLLAAWPNPKLTITVVLSLGRDQRMKIRGQRQGTGLIPAENGPHALSISFASWFQSIEMKDLAFGMDPASVRPAPIVRTGRLKNFSDPLDFVLNGIPGVAFANRKIGPS